MTTKDAKVAREFWIKMGDYHHEDVIRLDRPKNFLLYIHVREVTDDQPADVVEDVYLCLASLIPAPSNPAVEDWPCENPADRECLQQAFTKLAAIRKESIGDEGRLK